MRTLIDSVLSGKTGRGVSVYRGALGAIPSYESPHDFLRQIGKALSDDSVSRAAGHKQQISGAVFEYACLEICFQENIAPGATYYQVSFRREFPIHDILLYHETTPVVLSLKASLRERWIQAEHEGLVLKRLYRDGECHLITLDEEDSPKICKNIQKFGRGLDSCVLATLPEFTELISRLRGKPFATQNAISPVVLGGNKDRSALPLEYPSAEENNNENSGTSLPPG